MKVGDLKIVPIPGGIRAFGTDPNLSMDDLADAMFEGFLRSEAKLRESGRSHFHKPEATSMSTFGEKAVGITFNPSFDPDVQALKAAAAAFIDAVNDLRSSTQSGEKKRLYSLAITDAQAAQMWAVKAATWTD